MHQVGEWYHLGLVSNSPADRTDAQLGYFCGLDCLLVAVMKPYGLTKVRCFAALRGAHV